MREIVFSHLFGGEKEGETNLGGSLSLRDLFMRVTGAFRTPSIASSVVFSGFEGLNLFYAA